MSDFELHRVSGVAVSDDDLLDDLRRVAEHLGQESVSLLEYRANGHFADTTVSRRFGSWNKAIDKAGLERRHQEYTEDDLFENLLELWAHYGRQPRRRELSAAPSAISWTPYSRKFGSWTGALRAFVAFANGGTDDDIVSKPARAQGGVSQPTPRFPTLRQRFKVLQRDRFSCCACGRSPATDLDVVLEVDHLVPWAKGGPTILDNLQTLCRRCNSGKSDLMPTGAKPSGQ